VLHRTFADVRPGAFANGAGQPIGKNGFEAVSHFQVIAAITDQAAAVDAFVLPLADNPGAKIVFATSSIGSPSRLGRVTRAI
jgi:hypothetical protein